MKTDFNLSVGVTDVFMEVAKNERKFALINPRTRKKTRYVRTKALFDLIVNAAWRTGDPAHIFLNTINGRNPTPQIGQIEATNPRQSVNVSDILAKERGNLSNFSKSIYAGRNIKMRNATVNAIAPTGTISIIAGCSAGIEPSLLYIGMEQKDSDAAF